ncbi:MAG: hypothetical protein JRI56_09355 [Deltaproteobacteria bacterium]|nr:hypothetical protein [Deltaproteobacteria bacterium]
MKIEKEWRASSKPEKFGIGEELVNMAGRWNVGIEVSITKPYIYSQGPVERVIISSKGAHDRESLPLPNTS